MLLWCRHATWEGQPSCISSAVAVAVGPNWYFSSAVVGSGALLVSFVIPSPHSTRLVAPLPLSQSPQSYISCHPSDLRLWEIQRFVWREGFKTMPGYYHNRPPPPSLGLLPASDWSVRPHSRLWLVTGWLWGVGADTPWHLDTGDPQLLC